MLVGGANYLGAIPERRPMKEYEAVIRLGFCD